jgi:hypothetical protein
METKRNTFVSTNSKTLLLRNPARVIYDDHCSSIAATARIMFDLKKHSEGSLP